MVITLNDEEIRKVLLEEVAKKIHSKYVTDIDNCWFDVESADGKVEDIESVNFSCTVETEIKGDE